MAYKSYCLLPVNPFVAVSNAAKKDLNHRKSNRLGLTPEPCRGKMFINDSDMASIFLNNNAVVALDLSDLSSLIYFS